MASTQEKEGDYLVFYEDGVERIRYMLPKNVTAQDIEKFIAHLEQIAEERGDET